MTSFLRFAQLCQKAEEIRGSLEKIDLVAAFLAELDDSELAIASNFIMGRVFPSADMVLGVGPSILYEALAKACGCTSGSIQDTLRETGDPGLVAAVVAEKRRPLNLSAFSSGEMLTISDVYERFVSISRASGKRSQDAKVKNLQFLFGASDPIEAQYLARLAMEDLRIGIGEGGVRDAIAKAFSQPADLVERGYNLTNDIGLVAKRAKQGSLSSLNIMINHPIKMMLAQLGEGIGPAI